MHLIRHLAIGDQHGGYGAVFFDAELNSFFYGFSWIVVTDEETKVDCFENSGNGIAPDRRNFDFVVLKLDPFFAEDQEHVDAGAGSETGSQQLHWPHAEVFSADGRIGVDVHGLPRFIFGLEGEMFVETF